MRKPLLRVLYASEPEARAAVGEITSAGAWAEAVSCADSWGGVPRLSSRVEEFRLELPPDVLAGLSRRAMDGFVRTSLLAKRGAAVMGDLGRRRIDVLAFKGLASMACLYRSTRGRVSSDIDVLVAEQQLEQAVRALAELGFTADVDAGLDSYARFVKAAPGFGGNQELSMTDADGHTIDLHWRLGLGTALEAGELLGRAQEVEFLGETIKVPAVCDSLLISVHHALRNNFDPGHILRDTFDSEGWLRLMSEEDHPAKALEQAVSIASIVQLHVPLAAIVTIVTRWNQDSGAIGACPVLESRLSGQEREAAEELVHLFDLQAEEGPLNQDTTYLFRGHDFRRALAALLPGSAEHRDVMRKMDQAMGSKPSIGKRIEQAARAVAQMRPRHVKAMQTLARVKDKFEGTG